MLSAIPGFRWVDWNWNLHQGGERERERERYHAAYYVCGLLNSSKYVQINFYHDKLCFGKS